MRTIRSRRAGVAATETVLLYLLIAALVLLSATIFTRRLLRRQVAVVQSLEQGSPQDHKRVHYYRDYEDILGRRESFPMLYDLYEDGDAAHDGLQYAGLRVRHDDGKVTILEGGMDVTGKSVSMIARNETFDESSFLGEDNDLDDSLHAVGIDADGDRWLEGEMRFRRGEFAMDGATPGASVSGSDSGSLSYTASGGGTALEGEGRWKVLGEEIDVKARVGGADFSVGGGWMQDGKRSFGGLVAGGRALGVEVEMRKTIYGGESEDAARVDFVGSLNLGEANVGAVGGVGSTSTKRQSFSGAGGRLEGQANALRVSLGLEARSKTLDVPLVGRGQFTGSVTVSGQIGVGGKLEALAAKKKDGSRQVRAGLKAVAGLGGGAEFQVGFKPGK